MHLLYIYLCKYVKPLNRIVIGNKQNNTATSHIYNSINTILHLKFKTLMKNN